MICAGFEVYINRFLGMELMGRSNGLEYVLTTEHN